MNRQVLAKIAAWILAVVLVGVGIGFLSARTIPVAELVRDTGTADTYSISNVDAGGFGLVLLAVGLLVLAALLIAEGYGRSARKPGVFEETG